MQDNHEVLGTVLSALRRDLDSVLIPELTSPMAQTIAGMMSEILLYLTVWQRDLPQRIAAHDKARQENLEAAVALGAPSLVGADNTLLGDAIGPLTDYGQLSLALDEGASGLSEKVLADDAPDSAQPLRALFDRIVDADMRFFDEELALIAAERAGAKARLEGVEVEVTEDRLSDFVARRFPGTPGCKIESLNRIPGGYSKDTFSFTLVHGDGAKEDLVIRRDLPFGPGENTVLEEYDLLKALHGQGLPIAEPVWREEDKSFLGQAFIISRKMAGTPGTQGWEDDEAVRRKVCTDFAQLLGRLHAIDPATLGFDAGGDPAEHVRAYIRDWRDRWMRRRLHPSATLMAAFHWLEENIPDDLAPPSLVHTDVGFHNTLVEDGRLKVLLDWEFAHLGEPAEDLSYCRRYIEPLMPWEDFLVEYRGAGGAAYSEDRVRFYEVWRDVRNAICCSVAWYGFLSGSYPAMKMAVQGIPLYRRFVRDAAERLRGEWS